MATSKRPQQAEAGLPPLELDGEFHISRYIDVIKRRRMLLIVSVAVCLAFALVSYLRTPKAFRATTVIQIERNIASPLNVTQAMDSYWSGQAFLPTQIQLLGSRGLAERVARRLAQSTGEPSAAPSLPAVGSAGEPDRQTVARAQALMAGLDVQPIGGTNMVRLSFTTDSPLVAAQVANTYADTYVAWGIENRIASLSKSTAFLRAQIQSLKEDIQAGEERLRGLGAVSENLSAGAVAEATLSQWEGLQKEHISAISDRILKETLYRQLLGGAAPAPGGATAGPDHAVGSEPAEVAAARSAYEAALRREKALQQELERQKREVVRLGSAAVDYMTVKGEVATRRSLLSDLLKRQAEIELSAGLSGESNVTIIDRALAPSRHFRPSLVRNLPIGLAVGVLAGLLAIFVAEHLDRSIKTPDDVERVLGQSVVGTIPDMIEGRSRYGYYGYGKRRRAAGEATAERLGRSIPVELVCVSHPRLAVSEAYRSLRTAMMLSTANSLKSVLVTSAVAGEGKTVTASNLGVVLAQLGNSVLIVDADLRKPRQHEILGVSNRVGLVSFLTRQAAPEGVIQATSVPNLSVAPSGPTPPQPSELLASERMREFLAFGRERYDFVIVDSPPVLPVTDAAILSREVDGVLLCIGAGIALREDAKTCVERLAMVEAKLLGVVLNRLHQEGGRYRGKYYRHYYMQANGQESTEVLLKDS
jgi:capsular exopolysaccharide synthesis family protein